MVVNCPSTKREAYFFYALGCVKSIRRAGHDEDVVVLTHHMTEEQQRAFEGAGAIVRFVELIDRPCRTPRYFYDLQKLQFWSLPYRAVLAVDPDCLMRRKFDDWQLEELQAPVGGKSPLCSSKMFLRPSPETYSDIRACLDRWSFDPESGWERCGGMPWDFVAAEGAQGFLFYYFGVLRRRFFANHFPQIAHFGGRAKESEPYRAQLKALLGHDVP